MHLGVAVVLLGHRVLHGLLQVLGAGSRYVELVRRLGQLAGGLFGDAAQLVGGGLDLGQDFLGGLGRLLGHSAGGRGDDALELGLGGVGRGDHFIDAGVDGGADFGGTLAGLIDHAHHVFAGGGHGFFGSGLRRSQVRL